MIPSAHAGALLGGSACMVIGTGRWYSTSVETKSSAEQDCRLIGGLETIDYDINTHTKN